MEIPSYYDLLVPDHRYHLFNRAVGSEKMFIANSDYDLFLQKLIQHTSSVAEFYSYSLVPNHFHLLAQIKSLELIKHHYLECKNRSMLNCDEKFVSEFLMERFSNCFNSYTKSCNRKRNRKGKLFMDHLRRKEVITENYFDALIQFIHQDAMRHGYSKSVQGWPFSSYHSLISDQAEFILKDELLRRFGGRAGFIRFSESLNFDEVFKILDFKAYRTIRALSV